VSPSSSPELTMTKLIPVIDGELSESGQLPDEFGATP
jgi:hypothetical protein